MNKKIVSLIALLVVAVLGYLYASPYLVLNQIKNAAQANDSAKISEYIDYPSVRQGLKDQMNVAMQQKMEHQSNDPWQALGVLMATSMTDKIVDAVVTPQTMTLILQGQEFKKGMQGEKNPDTTPTPSHKEKPKYQAGYRSLNQFEVSVQDQQAEQVKVTMKREGLSWKIYRVDLALEKIS